MADFNVSLAAPQGVGAGVIAPVREPGFGDLLSAGADILSSIAKGKAESDKAKAQAADRAIIQQYAQKYSALSEDENLQALMPGQRKAMSEALFRQHVAANPHLIDEFKKVTSGMRDFGTITNDLEAVADVKAERKNKISTLSSRGYEVSSTDSDAQIDRLWAVNQHAVQIERLAEQKIKLESHGASMASAERSALQFNIEQESRKRVMAMGNDYLPALQTKADEILNKFKSGEIKDAATAKAAWDKLKMQFDQSVRTVTVGNEGMGAGFLEISKTLDANFNDALTGKTQTETLKNSVDLAMFGAQAKLLDKPENALFFGTLKMAPNALEKLISVTPKSDEFLRDVFAFAVGKGSVRSPEAAQGVSITVKGVSDQFTRTQDVATGKQLSGLFSKVLTELPVQDAYGADPKVISHLVQSLDDPNFADRVSAGEVPPEKLSSASAVLGRVWKDKVVENVSAKLGQPFTAYTSSNMTSTVQTDVASLTDIQFINGKVVFAPRAEKGVYLTPDELSQHRDVVKKMQSSSDAVSQIIRIDAYMAGEKDPSKTWEKNKHRYFPNNFPDPEVINTSKIYLSEGKKFKYNGGIPWRSKSSWEEVK